VFRLSVIELRRRRLAAALGVCAFAAVVPAAGIGLACLSAWRAQDGVEISDGGADLVAFLRDDLPASGRDNLAAALRRLPGVAGVRLLGSDEALGRMRSALGDHALVLDGVEEGFLPATLEVSLQPGRQGTGRVDAIAGRLRRMAGISSVDVLRTALDRRLERARLADRRLVHTGLAVGAAVTLLALVLAAAALRRRRADAHLMAGLGFSVGAVGLPGAIAGATCALAGTALGGALAGGAAYLGRTWLRVAVPRVSAPWSASSFPGLVGCVIGAFAVAVLVGAALGWWGARPGIQEIDDLA
jgi:cell division protein FtsX